MSPSMIILITIAAVILAFPASILMVVSIGFLLEAWENSSLFLWLKKRNIREGQVIVRRPEVDIKEEIWIIDLSKLAQNEVGVRIRRRNLYPRNEQETDYGELTYVSLRSIVTRPWPNYKHPYAEY
jgi:hypothetical protein